MFNEQEKQNDKNNQPSATIIWPILWWSQINNNERFTMQKKNTKEWNYDSIIMMIIIQRNDNQSNLNDYYLAWLPCCCCWCDVKSEIRWNIQAYIVDKQAGRQP